MTAKEIFMKVRKHLLKQNKKAMLANPKHDDEGSTCQYRLGNLRCAIGCLIPDELYSREIEGAGVEVTNGVSLGDSECLLVQILIEAGIPANAFPLLADLQYVHDGHDPERWAEKLNELHAIYFRKRK